MIKILVSVAAILCPVSLAYGWGANGHSIIAEIAERRLTPTTAAAVKTLVGGERSLASLSGWADYIQLLKPETRNWHFVNIPYDAIGYVEARDCKSSPAGDCIVKAIERVAATLADDRQPRAARLDALLFLIHLIGDAHQPLHCADKGDAGGSRLQVSFFGAPTNLHLVWDVSLIERRTFYWGEFVEQIERSWLPGKDAVALSAGSVVDWVNDCHRHGVEVAYRVPDDLVLGDDYVSHAMPVMEQQLALAGLRLARLLNESLDHASNGSAQER